MEKFFYPLRIERYEELIGAEAMWKGAAVIGGDCGGIRAQSEDGVSGFRVSVRRNFLMSRLLEQYLDLFSAFEPRFLLRPQNNLPGNQIEI